MMAQQRPCLLCLRACLVHRGSALKVFFLLMVEDH